MSNNEKFTSLLSGLEMRFNKNMNRHPNQSWDEIYELISENQKLLSTINYMEQTKGEPDLLEYNNKLLVVDFSKESPDRRSICYDREARISRKKFPPQTSAWELANENDLILVDEKMYLYMQSLQDLDTKTTIWLNTPDDFRSKGGALTGERRYDRTFISHNGADSYYASRGFRGYIEIK